MSKATNDQVKNLIQIRKSLSRGKAGNLADNAAFLDFLAIQKQMTAEVDKTWALVRERMEQYDVQKIDGDWGVIQLIPTEYLKAIGPVRSEFTKQVLDNDKVKAYRTLRGKLPRGVQASITNKFYKKIKLA